MYKSQILIYFWIWYLHIIFLLFKYYFYVMYLHVIYNQIKIIIPILHMNSYFIVGYYGCFASGNAYPKTTIQYTVSIPITGIKLFQFIHYLWIILLITSCDGVVFPFFLYLLFIFLVTKVFCTATSYSHMKRPHMKLSQFLYQTRFRYR